MSASVSASKRIRLFQLPRREVGRKGRGGEKDMQFNSIDKSMHAVNLQLLIEYVKNLILCESWIFIKSRYTNKADWYF